MSDEEHAFVKDFVDRIARGSVGIGENHNAPYLSRETQEHIRAAAASRGMNVEFSQARFNGQRSVSTRRGPTW